MTRLEYKQRGKVNVWWSVPLVHSQDGISQTTGKMPPSLYSKFLLLIWYLCYSCDYLDSCFSCSLVLMQIWGWCIERCLAKQLTQLQALAGLTIARQPSTRSIWTPLGTRKIRLVSFSMETIWCIDRLIWQKSTCVKHHAVINTNTSKFANLSSSGIGTIDCIRHTMKRSHSVGDLQGGEA